MPIESEIRRLLRNQPVDEDAAVRLWGAILDDAVDGTEVGAVLATLATRGESADELAGLLRAARARIAPWSPAFAGDAIAIPAYGLFQGESLVVSLAVALLQRFGMPVVVHGVLDSPCGVSSARALRELDILPCASLLQADDSLRERGVAFLPVQLVSPAFAGLIALRSRLGLENAAHIVAQALDPTQGRSIRITFRVGGTASERYALLDGAAPGDSLALAWPAGRSPLNLAIRPRIERVRAGEREVLFEADAQETRTAFAPPPEDAPGMARWIQRVMRGELPVPVPALNLAAACLYAVGRAPDFSQAKAIAAVNAGRLAA